jgi:hypothetical protein
VTVHGDLLETVGRNRAARALIVRAGAEWVGGSVCAADVAEWRKGDTRVADPRLRRSLTTPVVGLQHPASQPARASR